MDNGQNILGKFKEIHRFRYKENVDEVYNILVESGRCEHTVITRALAEMIWHRMALKRSGRYVDESDLDHAIEEAQKELSRIAGDS